MDWEKERVNEARLLLHMQAAEAGNRSWDAGTWTFTVVAAAVVTAFFGWHWVAGLAVAIGLVRLVRARHEVHVLMEWLTRAGFSREWVDAEVAAADKGFREGSEINPCVRWRE